MRERRKEPRKNLAAFTQVFDLYGGALIGNLGDINMLGAMVIGEKPLTEDTEMTLAIELPELKGITATRMSIPARVAWCQPDLSPEYFNIGFEFKLVTDGQKNIIQAIIESYEFTRNVPNDQGKPLAKKQ